MRRTLVILVAGLLLGACGGDDDDDAAPTTTAQDEGGDAGDYVDAAAAALTADDGPQLDDTQAHCFATEMVDLFGADALAEAGVSPDEFAEADSFADLDVEIPDGAQTRVSSALVECEVVGPLRELMAASFIDEFGVELSPDAETCLSGSFEEQAVADGWAITFLDGSTDDIENLLAASVGTCPELASEIILSQAPTELTPEAEACVRAFVAANPQAVSEAFASGGSSAETQQLGAEMAAACPGAFG
ncbi:MAG TPA: hypothetical protein VH479_18405 [Acidimicrobiales bacterium]|jgi:hypothetical protein